MSETVTYKGKLTLISDLKTFLENNYEGFHDLDPCDYVESFYEDFYDTNVLHKGNVYSVEREDLGYEDIFQVTDNGDETFDFLVKYYNGGCGFNEAIEYGFEEMEQM